MRDCSLRLVGLGIRLGLVLRIGLVLELAMVLGLAHFTFLLLQYLPWPL